MVRAARPLLVGLGLALSACGKAPKSREAYVWNAEAECWEERPLERPVRYLSDGYLLFAVDEEGTCWRIPGTRYRPEEWGEQPVSTAEACGDARYSNDFCEDTGG